jgi:hypothetical protein
LGVWDEVEVDGVDAVGTAGVPQARQKFFPGVRGCPQFEQACSKRAPHSSQKRAASSFSARHLGQFTEIPGLEFRVLVLLQ